jgi:hypothetical protein
MSNYDSCVYLDLVVSTWISVRLNHILEFRVDGVD